MVTQEQRSRADCAARSASYYPCIALAHILWGPFSWIVALFDDAVEPHFQTLLIVRTRGWGRGRRFSHDDSLNATHNVTKGQGRSWGKCVGVRACIHAYVRYMCARTRRWMQCGLWAAGGCSAACGRVAQATLIVFGAGAVWQGDNPKESC